MAGKDKQSSSVCRDVDPSKAFLSYDSFQTMMKDDLLPALTNANSNEVAALALEGLFSVERQHVKSGQLNIQDEVISTFLRDREMAHKGGIFSSDAVLSKAFLSYDSFQTMMKEGLLPALTNANSAAVAVLALEGLIRVDTPHVKSGQLDMQDEAIREGICTFLRKWRCNSPLSVAYGGRTKAFLDGLTIFGKSKVPLFIDNRGTKRLMTDFRDQVEPINIDLDTPIVHVTHTVQKEAIVSSGMFKPSKNKNAMEGIWFSIKDYLKHESGKNELRSRYGNWAFETTLRKLGITGLHQGEIVSYKQEVNFILYASNTGNFSVMRATDSALDCVITEDGAHAAVSIFVPWDFVLPEIQAPRDPFRISHGPICVPKRRKGELCPDIDSRD